MKMHRNALERIVWGLILAALIGSGCVGQDISQATPAPTIVVTALVADTAIPGAVLTDTYPLPLQPNFIPSPVAYDPPGTPPGPLPIPTPWPIWALPTLSGYEVPGPFSKMRMLYTNSVLGGFRVVDLGGVNEIMLEAMKPFAVSSHDLIRLSPDGTQILFLPGSSMNIEDCSIWSINPDGSNLHVLVDPGPEDKWYPYAITWSPDGKQIAYLRVDFSQYPDPEWRELWVMDADGSNQRLVFNDSGSELLYGASSTSVFDWMRNGYIYFSNVRDQLHAINPEDGSTYTLMYHVDWLDLRFSLSPDGQHAVNRGELTSAMLQEAGFVAQSVPGSPITWSTDGALVVYSVHDRDFWLRNVVTGESWLLLNNDPYQTIRFYAISPGNQYLVYQTDAGLFVLDLTQPDSLAKLVLADPPDERGDWDLKFVAWIPIP